MKNQTKSFPSHLLRTGFPRKPKSLNVSSFDWISLQYQTGTGKSNFKIYLLVAFISVEQSACKKALVWFLHVNILHDVNPLYMNQYSEKR